MEVNNNLPVMNPENIPDATVDAKELSDMCNETVKKSSAGNRIPELKINYTHDTNSNVGYGEYVLGRTYKVDNVSNTKVIDNDGIAFKTATFAMLAMRYSYQYRVQKRNQKGELITKAHGEVEEVGRETIQFYDYFNDEIQEIKESISQIPDIVVDSNGKTAKGVITCYGLLLHENEHLPFIFKFRGCNYKVFEDYSDKLSKNRIPYYAVLTTLPAAIQKTADGNRSYFEIEEIISSKILPKEYIASYHTESVKLQTIIDKMQQDMPNKLDIYQRTGSHVMPAKEPASASESMDIEIDSEDATKIVEVSAGGIAGSIPNINTASTKPASDTKSQIISHGKLLGLSGAQMKTIVASLGHSSLMSIAPEHVDAVKAAFSQAQAATQAYTEDDSFDDVPF